MSLTCTKKSNATIYFGAGVGTQGISFGASYYWKNIIGLRGVYDYMPDAVVSPISNIAKNASDLITDASAKFSSWGFDLSVRPFRGSFHIDAGFRMMDYSVSVNGAKRFDVYAGVMPMHFDISGKFKFTIANGIKPYVGLGWDFNPIVGLTLGFDVGVIYTGKWKASIENITTNYNVGGNNANYRDYRNVYRVANNDTNNTYGSNIESILRDLNINLDANQINWNDVIEQYGDDVSVLDSEGNEINIGSYFEQHGENNLAEALINQYSEDIENGQREVYNIRDDINKAVPSFASFWPVIKFNIGYKFDII